MLFTIMRVGKVVVVVTVGRAYELMVEFDTFSPLKREEFIDGDGDSKLMYIDGVIVVLLLLIDAKPPDSSMLSVLI